MQENSKHESLSSWDVAYALNMAIACAISYWITIDVLSSMVSEDADLLGGMLVASGTEWV